MTNQTSTAPLVHPKKFLVWLIIVSMLMLFAAMTSAYIVRKGEGNWLEFQLPISLLYSTIVISLSSVVLYLAERYNKKGDKQKAVALTGLTLLLGCGFLVLQNYSWVELINYKYPVVFGGSYSNPSGSFLYVLVGLHAVHLISGLIYLLIVFISLIVNRVNKDNRLRLEMCSTFWHALGGLWLFLYLFLAINHYS